MTKRTSAKHKIDRRMGENIWGRPKSPVNRREYGPGQHGQRRKARLSDFGLQLRAKQKLKGYYGDLTEKQFRRIYSEAERIRGDTGENLIGLLERRLDAVVYRAKFVATMFAARQFVNHGHVTVNGKRVNIPSYRVKEGDVIEVRDSLLYINGVAAERDYIGPGSSNADIETSGDFFTETFESQNGKDHEHVIWDKYPNAMFNNFGPYTVPEDHLFFMGDNRDNSGDSRSNRDLGLVHKRFLIGKAEIVLFSLNIQAHPEDLYFWAYWNPFRWGRFVKIL